MSLEGKIQLQSDLVPVNDNPRMFVTESKYIAGAPQVFVDIAELVLFHPDKMRSGMPATILNWPNVGTITDFRLNTNPSQLKDVNNNSIITADNFQQFWAIQSQTITPRTRVYQYAPDTAGGGAPTYPYTVGTEPNWSNIRDTSKGHKWLRFRDDDVDDNDDGIFDNWTVPLSIATQFITGDYLENRFRRQAVSSTQHTASGTLLADKYYTVDAGRIQIDGDLSLNDIGEYGEATQAILTIGRYFKYAAGNTYTFLDSAIATETLKVPPRTEAGVANNEPAGWTDTIPGGTDQLWQITGQKSVYQQLKSDWVLTKIIEDPNYVRYSNTPSPHPDTIAGPNTSANSGSSEDTALEAVGWNKVYNNHQFIAKRVDDPGPNLYTNWLVEKINEESGEFVDRVFKLFDINLDSDSPALAPPTDRDPTREEWSDSPLEETDTQINYISEARKFFNGELKTPWSQPVPYTGKSTFIDTIDSDLGDSFKYDAVGAVMPAAITLQANLYRGTSKLWEYLTITYAWKKVYDNGGAVDVSPSTNPADDFYLLAAAGTPGDPGYLRADQRVVVKPGAVNGDAVFRCTQTIAMPEGDDLVFIEEMSILDVSDGKDAKALALRADSQTILFDVTNSIHVPSVIDLRAYSSNIPSPTFYWYRWNGSSWVKFTAADANHTFPVGVNGNNLHIDIFQGTLTVVSDAVFAEPGTGADATLTSAGNNLPAMSVSDVFEVRNHSIAALNGSWEVVTVNVSTGSYEVNKLSGGAAVDGASESIDIYTNNSYLFAEDTDADEERYAVSTHSSNPLSADNINTFSDYTTISKLGTTNIGAPGADAVLGILSNESHTLIIDSVTLSPVAGEIGSSGRALTTLQVYEGVNPLVYGGGGDYTIGVSSSEAGIVFDFAANGDNVDIFVDSWDSGEIAAVCTITITYGAIIFTKTFSVSSTKDAPGALLIDVDSDRGFVFVPGDSTPKVLSAKVYDSTMEGSQDVIITAAEATIADFAAASGSYTFVERANIILLGSSGPLFLSYRYNGGTKTLVGSYTALGATEYYTFRWNVNAVWGSQTTTNRQTINRSDILTNSVITVEMYQNSILLRSRTVSVTDVNDGVSYRAWTDNATKPNASQDLTAQDPLALIWPVTVSGVVWRLPSDPHWASNVPTYSQDAEEAAGVYTWGAVYQLKGEKGDQGLAGGFFFAMYKAESPGPPSFGAGGNVSTLAQQLAAGWLSRPPSTGTIWKSERLWIGEGVSFNGSGDPSTGPFTGSVWIAPVRLSGTDGIDGDDGANGNHGYAPTWAIVAGPTPGTKVMQLVSWIGGTGPTPGHEGEYIGVSGFVADINLANPVNGDPVEMQYNATTGYTQWKYTTEGGGAWRNLYLTPLSEFMTGVTGPILGIALNGITFTNCGSAGLATITAKDYRRRVLIRVNPLITVSSGLVQFDISLRASFNGGGYSQVASGSGATNSNGLRTSAVEANFELPAGQTLDFQIWCKCGSGGTFEPLFGDNLSQLQLIPY